jgi:DnaK suppressor protein
MNDRRARELLDAERAKLQQLLHESDDAARADRAAVDEPSGFNDPAEPLTSEGVDDAIAAGVRDRLAALDRAEQRLATGMYGRSIRSGRPIPDERLEADPGAELTVDEADES